VENVDDVEWRIKRVEEAKKKFEGIFTGEVVELIEDLIEKMIDLRIHEHTEECDHYWPDI
jgi:hypothetical protein